MSVMVLRADARQQTALSPRLQHAVRLLQMSSVDYVQQLVLQTRQNPFLEFEENEPEAALEAADDGTDEQDLWQADGSVGGSGSADGEFSALDRVPFEASLAASLHAQLALQRLPVRELALARVIVDCLDDDGYLRLTLDELAPIAGLDPAPDAYEMHLALCRVQSLEPLGVAARSVAECLQLQLPLIECEIKREIARRIIVERIDALAARDVSGLAKGLGVDVLQVEQVCDRIRRLDPRPGWHVGGADVRYLTPDLVVKKARGVWTADLNPVVVPRLRLNQVYATMFERHRSAHNAELAAHLHEARWAVRNVDQRFATILAVGKEIVKRQRLFFDHGSLAMKALGLREIAQEIGVHESTVSRVTNNKYMATPMGVFELKTFFSRAMPMASGGSCAPSAIRGVIKEMIASERASAPVSDAEIARRLAGQGLVVARRTVTKYRQTLKLESVDRRRVHGVPAGSA